MNILNAIRNASQGTNGAGVQDVEKFEVSARVADDREPSQAAEWTGMIVASRADMDATAPVVAAPVYRIPDPDVQRVDSIGVLRTDGRRGDAIAATQTADKRFSRVSDEWTAQCLSFEQAREQMERERGNVVDLLDRFGRFAPTVDESGAFKMLDTQTGALMELSPHALGQLAQRANVGAHLPSKLICGDVQDATILRDVLANGLRHCDPDAKALVRTRADGTIRAFLSGQYAIIDNRWFLDVLESIIPGGLVSHFRGDGDSVFFNVLIPDSLRAESDSPYGGMLACGNSEIGVRKLASMPSVFRWICRNGCIWDRVDGVAYAKRVHRGRIDLDTLRAEIRDNLNRQIPLLNSGIDMLLNLRPIVAADLALPAPNAIASALSRVDAQISRKQADSILAAYAIEKSESAVSAFDLVNAFTRAAQEFEPQAQENAERAAGSMLLWNGAKWSRVFQDGAEMIAKSLGSTFASLAV